MKSSLTGNRRLQPESLDQPDAQASGSYMRRWSHNPQTGGVRVPQSESANDCSLGKHICGPWRVGGADHSAPQPEATASSAFAGLRVLLVDDSLDTLEAFRTLLELEGAQVMVADNGHAALGLATSRDFDLILSDIGMPGMDGYELIGLLRAHPRTAAVPAFALSGFSDQAGVTQALQRGFDAYIDKPVTLGALIRALRGLPAV